MTYNGTIETDYQGEFIKPCPGTPLHVCCGYEIINFARGCTLGCNYCILDCYFGQERPTVFSNRGDLYHEVESALRESDRFIRYGTGEFTDSLLFEKDYPIYDRLIPLFANQDRAVLEIKTKTVNVQPLLEMKERENIIVSWSLNSDYIARKDEARAPSVGSRIEAARKVQERGFKLGFHFDPIIHHSGWKDGYGETIALLFSSIDPEKVVYISMGTLRFMPSMADHLKRAGTGLELGEFVRGIDGKSRYFRPLRTRIYREVLSRLEEHVDRSRVYLCMESPEVWKDVFGIDNMDSQKLKERLDEACYSRFDGLRRPPYR